MALRHKTAHLRCIVVRPYFVSRISAKQRFSRQNPQFCHLKEHGECEIHWKMHGKHFQATDFAESHMDDAWTPPDTEVTHWLTRHDGGAMLSMHFHDARCGGAPSGVWKLTHGVGLDAQRGVSDSRILTVRQLTHSWRTDRCLTCLKRMDLSTETLGLVLSDV